MVFSQLLPVSQMTHTYSVHLLLHSLRPIHLSFSRSCPLKRNIQLFPSFCLEVIVSVRYLRFHSAQQTNSCQIFYRIIILVSDNPCLFESQKDFWLSCQRNLTASLSIPRQELPSPIRLI
jgi:hypothetical protein